MKYGVCSPDGSGLPGVSEPALSTAEEVSLRYSFFPLPGQERGQRDGRKGFSAPCQSRG